MKSISPFKFLTAVGFLIVSLSAGAAEEKKTEDKKPEVKSEYKNKQNCIDINIGLNKYADICKKNHSKPNADGKILEPSADEIEACQDKRLRSKECADTKAQSDIDAEKKEAKGDCNTATKEYNTAVKDARGACESFEKVSGGEKNSCQTRINSCRKKIGSAVASNNPDENEIPEEKKKGEENLMDMLLGVAQQKLNSNDPNKQKSPDSNPSCVNYKSKEDRKEKKNDAKDLVKEMQRMKEKIADERKKITEENAKIREKNAEIKVDTEKIGAASKKTINDINGKKNDRIRKSNEELEKTAIALRGKNTEIVDEKEKIETKKFEYAQQMLQFSTEKIEMKCQTEIEMAKQCLQKSSKNRGNIAAQSDKDPCAGLSLSNKGSTKATRELIQKISKLRDECFVQANTAITRGKFEYGKSLRQSQKIIETKQSEIQDINNTIERKKNETEQINAESNKELSDEEESAKKQADNLSEKLQSLQKSTDEAVKHSNDKIAEFQKELDELTAKQLAVKAGILEPEELDNSLSDAEGLIGEREAARQNAVSICCPELAIDNDKSYTNKEIKKMNPKCSSLIRGGINQNDGGGRSGTSSNQIKQ